MNACKRKTRRPTACCLARARAERAECEGRSGSPTTRRSSVCYLNAPITPMLDSKLTVGRRLASTDGRTGCWAVRLEWPPGGPAPNALHSGPARLKFIGLMQPEEHVCSADSLPSKIHRSSRRAPRFS